MRALRRDLPALRRRDTEETTPPPPAEGRQLSHSPGLKVTLQHLGSQSPYKPAAWELQQHIWPVEVAGNRDTWLRTQELVLCSAHHGTRQRRVSRSHLPDLQGDKKRQHNLTWREEPKSPAAAHSLHNSVQLSYQPLLDLGTGRLPKTEREPGSAKIHFPHCMSAFI